MASNNGNGGNGGNGRNGGNGGNGDVQRAGPSTVTSPSRDLRVFNHRGTDVGEDNVSVMQNDTGRLDAIIEWTIPKKYRTVALSGGRHWTKAQFRSRESFDGDGDEDTFTLEEDLVAIAGEEELDEQPYPVVVAYDSDAGEQLTVEDVDYAANEVTFESAPNDADDNVIVWPVMGEGAVQYRGLDAFGNLVGPHENWTVPIHVFADKNQDRNILQIHLPGSARYERAEKLAFYVDAPREVVWEDDDYPEGQWVSSIEQQVDVEL